MGKNASHLDENHVRRGNDADTASAVAPDSIYSILTRMYSVLNEFYSRNEKKTRNEFQVLIPT